MMSNQNMSASTANQQHRPSMASSLFAEGISRVMDFLSKSPSQKSSPTAQQQQRSESAKTQSFSTQQLHAYGARSRANSYNDTERSRTALFSPGNGFDVSDSARNVPGNASSGQILSSSGARRQGGYHQNNGGIDDYRRAPMASIEEKDGSKGMRLSESDEGFVLVDPTPLPAAPHPWRGNVAGAGGASVLSAKHNYSSSGKPQSAFHSTNNAGNGTGTSVGAGVGTGGAWTDGPGREQYDMANQKSPNHRSSQPGQPLQGSQYHMQAQHSGSDAQHCRPSSASSSTKDKDKDRERDKDKETYKDKDRDRDRDRSNRSELSLPQFNENEKFAIAGMTQRSEYVCQVVTSIVRVGDCMAKEILAIEKKKDFFAGKTYVKYCDFVWSMTRYRLLHTCFV